jgi:hypothetical protein
MWSLMPLLPYPTRRAHTTNNDSDLLCVILFMNKQVRKYAHNVTSLGGEGVHAEYVMYKVALEQDLIPSSSVFPVNIIPPWLSIPKLYMRDEQHSHWGDQFRHTFELIYMSNDNV